MPNRFVDTYKPEEIIEPESKYSVYWGGGVDEAPATKEYDNLVDLLNAEGFKFRVSSGFRPGSKTKQGRVSHHSEGDENNPGAYDIVPLDGNFTTFR